MVDVIMFYVFSLFLIGSCAAVVSLRNPVHSVLALIVAFFNVSALAIILGAELIAMMIMIVYVGAIAVLFLFIVMMLSTRHSRLLRKFNLKAVVFLGSALIVEFTTFFILTTLRSDGLNSSAPVSQHQPTNDLSNVLALGQSLYTDCFMLFQLSGLILLVAMMGAIVLCLPITKNNSSQVHEHEKYPSNKSGRRAIELIQAPLQKGISEW